jgi:hypothetical protein
MGKQKKATIKDLPRELYRKISSYVVTPKTPRPFKDHVDVVSNRRYEDSLSKIDAITDRSNRTGDPRHLREYHAAARYHDSSISPHITTKRYSDAYDRAMRRQAGYEDKVNIKEWEKKLYGIIHGNK